MEGEKLFLAIFARYLSLTIRFRQILIFLSTFPHSTASHQRKKCYSVLPSKLDKNINLAPESINNADEEKGAEG